MIPFHGNSALYRGKLLFQFQETILFFRRMDWLKMGFFSFADEMTCSIVWPCQYCYRPKADLESLNASPFSCDLNIMVSVFLMTIFRS